MYHNFPFCCFSDSSGSTLNSNLTNNTGANKYYSFPNGLKVCWGKAVLTPTGSDKTSNTVITLPIAVSSPGITLTVDSGNGGRTLETRAAQTDSTHFLIFLKADIENYTPVGCYWIAIGT